jgi:hypothetical protein
MAQVFSPKETAMRSSLSSTNARIDSLEAKLDQVLAALQGGSAATPAAPKAPKAPKAEKSAKPTYLRQSTRKAFIAASEYDLTGWSTKEIAAYAVNVNADIIPAGFAIGEGYTALVSA